MVARKLRETDGRRQGGQETFFKGMPPVTLLPPTSLIFLILANNVNKLWTHQLINPFMKSEPS
jgi:hypothetical protein